MSASLSTQEIQYIIQQRKDEKERRSDPEVFKAAFLEYLKQLPVVISPPITYLLTFTYNTSSKQSKTEWFKLLLKQLGSKLFLTIDACIEHIDTNIHCHALVTTKHPNLSRAKFVAWCKKHPLLDIKKVKPTTTNTVHDYITKENPSYTDLIEFENFYAPKLT